MWATDIARRVLLIRDKVLRTFANDYAWTAEADDQYEVVSAEIQRTGNDSLITKAPELFTPAAINRGTMSEYYVHEFCYSEEDALIP